MSKYVLIWPSGAGGDFLLTMMHLIKPFGNIKAVGANMLINQWDTFCPDHERPFEPYHRLPDVIKYLKELEDGHVAMLHDKHAKNEKIADLLFNSDYKIVNIYEHDELTKLYINDLYNIKVRSAESINRKYAFVREMQTQNYAENFAYHDLLIEPKQIDIFVEYFDREVTPEISELLLRCIKLYKILNLQTLYYNYSSQLSDAKKDYTQIQQYKVMFESFDELISAMEKSIDKYQKEDYV